MFMATAMTHPVGLSGHRDEFQRSKARTKASPATSAASSERPLIAVTVRKTTGQVSLYHLSNAAERASLSLWASTNATSTSFTIGCMSIEKHGSLSPNQEFLGEPFGPPSHRAWRRAERSWLRKGARPANPATWSAGTFALCGRSDYQF